MMEILWAIAAGVGAFMVWMLAEKRRKLPKSALPPPSIEKLHRYSLRDQLPVAILACAACFVIGMLFYKNGVAAGLLALCGLLAPRLCKRAVIDKRKRDLLVQFKMALYSLATSLGAGKSVENSLADAITDLSMLYGGGQSVMIGELTAIRRKIENGVPIEQAMREFSELAHIDDITNFAEVFASCKRSGGDLSEVIRRTSHIIGDKIEIQQEIAVMVAQKKFEANALSVVPFAVIAAICYGSPDYAAPLYAGAGRIIMTTALLILACCVWLARTIMNVKV
ncbi:MAG TPA: type II secretion system F family protein [Bacilli bacterium]